MNLIKLFRPSKALEGTVTIPDKSELCGSMTLQITLLMEQYIQSNTEIALSTKVEDYSVLVNEYSKLCNLGLENTKNARIIKEQINNFNESYQNKVKAEELIKFIKKLRNHFGDSTLLISSEQFEKLCKKYKLKTGLLSEYTGIIPYKNIEEIENAVNKIRSFSYNLNSYSHNSYLWKITDCECDGISDSCMSVFNDTVQWVKSKNYIIAANQSYYNSDNSLWLTDIVNVNPDIPKDMKNYKNKSLIKLKGVLINSKTMFIACPPEQLKKQTLKITKKAIDPIVFQYSPYGIVVHSVWGEEAEDKVFEEYKRVNQLLSL